MARFKSPELGVQLQPFCWLCNQPEPRHRICDAGWLWTALRPWASPCGGCSGRQHPPIVLGLVMRGGLTTSSCSAAAGAPGLLPCGSKGELQYLQQLRSSAAVLAAYEKECCGACGTGAAPPIVPGLVTGWGLAASSKGATATAWAFPMRCGLQLLPVVLGLVTGRGQAASSLSVTAAATGRLAAKVGVDVRPPSAPLLAELKALGVCPCRIHCFWQNKRHSVCAHAEFTTFGITESIGCIPLQNFVLLAARKAPGVCPCRIYCFSRK